jgi:glycerophosphoryl diester phosphodiesterase
VGTVGIRQNRLDAGVLASLRGHGLAVGAWAVNDAESIGRMLGLGIDVFTTDLPSLALQLRR